MAPAATRRCAAAAIRPASSAAWARCVPAWPTCRWTGATTPTRTGASWISVTSSCRSSSGASPTRRGPCGRTCHAFVAFCLFWMPDAAAVLAAIEAHRVTKLFLPSTAIYRLLGDPARTRHDLSSLRRLAYSAAPMNTTRLRESVDAFLARRPPHDHAWRAGRADCRDRDGNVNPWSLRRRRPRARSPVAVDAIPCRRFASGGRVWPMEVNPPCRRTGASREGRCGSRRRAPIARTGRAP